MGAIVKRESAPLAKTHLEKAGDAQDRFVATIGDVVTRKLVEILEGGENEVARVSAAKALMDWIRPKAGGIAIQVNTGANNYTSHLGLPAPQPPVVDAVDAELVEAPRPKVLPEPASPMAEARLTQRTQFDALRDLQAEHAPAIAKEELNRARSPSPRTPDKPEPASNIKAFR